MSKSMNELLNNLSLMLVMVSDDDSQAIEILLALCDDIRRLAESGNQSRLVAAVNAIRRTKPEETFKDIQAFTPAALLFVEDPENTTFPHETTDTPASSDPDVSPSVDSAFLTEFIETHSILLEEFEVGLVEFQQSGNGADELATSVKRYLHNLKGDAGSIGLFGIEQVCHALEDRLLASSIEAVTAQLLSAKEWVVSCLRAYAQGAPTPKQASLFLAELPAATANVTQTSEPIGAADSSYVLSGEPEILLEFSAEAEEHLNNVESVILESEGNFSKDAIDTIFRGVHSLKGGSAYFQLEEMTTCSHILENFLSQVRDGSRSLDADLNRLLLTYIDLQKDTLSRAKAALKNDGRVTRSAESAEFLSCLDRYEKGLSVSTPPKTDHLQSDSEPSLNAVNGSDSEEAKARNGKLNVKDFVKVDTSRLDHLVESIGEMVIYSSMLIRDCRQLLGMHEAVMDTTHRVEKISRDLQDIGMSMRLVPIKGLFQKMSRLVWDTSKKLGKEIQFTMQGEDTELDRNLIDKLADPLMHMVRNSLDHGVESTEVRLKKGKPRGGTVTLSAFHAGGNIHIQVKDDGQGLNPEKIFAKAVEKGIVSASQKLSESEIFQLIFAPGFSTASVVTDISGRGVGMDVVRRNVESLRGRIHIQSEIDKGSTFTIELPLTLAIIDGIQIRVGSEYFITPSLSIIEVVRPKKSAINAALDFGETFHFRGKYLPVFRISTLYGIEPEFTEATDSTIIVVENGHELVALMVDEVLGQCSTVIKSLGPVFEEGKGLAGCAIMPSGDVALILDIRFLVQLARKDYKSQELPQPVAQ